MVDGEIHSISPISWYDFPSFNNAVVANLRSIKLLSCALNKPAIAFLSSWRDFIFNKASMNISQSDSCHSSADLPDNLFDGLVVIVVYYSTDTIYLNSTIQVDSIEMVRLRVSVEVALYFFKNLLYCGRSLKNNREEI